MPYTVTPSPKVAEELTDLVAWVDEELRAVEASQYDDIIALELRPTHREPIRPREGMIVYADGTDWNPGSGEGPYVYINGAWASLFGRVALAANRTYYVRSDGSNSNTGLVDSAGGAFLTLQKAIDVVAALDLAGFAVTIQVRSGTFSGFTVSRPFIGGSVSVLGDVGTPANVIINSAITVQHNAEISIGGCQFQNASGNCLVAGLGGSITVNGASRFGTSTGAHIRAESQGGVYVAANYTIAGGAVDHWRATTDGQIDASARTVTTSGTPAFSEVFSWAEIGGNIKADLMTFNGSGATGTRWRAVAGGIIYTNGAGASYLPGSAVGSEATGGIYA